MTDLLLVNYYWIILYFLVNGYGAVVTARRWAVDGVADLLAVPLMEPARARSF